MDIRLTNDLSDLDRLAEEVGAFCATEGIEQSEALQLNLVLEEIFTNIVSYGYEDARAHEIVVTLESTDGGIRAQVIDDAKAFNPLEVDAADTSSSVEDRQIGGLGLHFLRKMTRDQSYWRKGGRNHLTFVKPVETG
ncbi:ATP-binding protein [Fodinicurvata halophila]|uniref:ATP-binding protein n=1 Tax=Fodinicurvata halophila TaxID=1419723 RepID=A0ABV8UMI8_9PROT